MAKKFTGLGRKPTKKEIIFAWILFLHLGLIIFITVFDLDIDIGLIILFWFIVMVPTFFIGWHTYSK